eukprot:gnl/Spiro4/1890_TR887_c0_g1_i2.p1 gnl/Spiro4/1890_TR887_c0_g1~~gnl/Spiro4/1890_TR887_c0_g1_i2.p1  ORF type:complete len:164 (+),score=4.53 gnl/Spiro4/1890_TR887_c0_g1_i2:92-583(+)
MSSKSSATKRTATNMGTRACTNRLEPDDNRLTRTKPADVLSLYKMLYVTQHLLKKHGVIFWMSGGTFLGAVRHQGLIPWDDDADIEVFAADAPRIAAFESEFRELGFSTCPHNCGMKSGVVIPLSGHIFCGRYSRGGTPCCRRARQAQLCWGAVPRVLPQQLL